MDKQKVIPTHDPQTGEVNPYYEELTGENNPFNSIHNPDLYREIYKQQMKYTSKMKDFSSKPEYLKDMPDQKLHKITSFIKSSVRIAGYGFIPFDLTIACVVLIISEVVGIIEEMV